MKFFLCIIATTFLLTGQIYCSSADLKAERKLFEECAKEVGVNIEQFPKNYESKFKCAMACTVKKMGLMKNGKVDATKYLIYTMKDKMTTESEIKDVLNCADMGNLEKNECDVVDVVIKCNMERAKTSKRGGSK